MVMVNNSKDTLGCNSKQIGNLNSMETPIRPKIIDGTLKALYSCHQSVTLFRGQLRADKLLLKYLEVRKQQKLNQLTSSCNDGASDAAALL